MVILFIVLIVLSIILVLALVFYEFVFLRDPERKISGGRNIVSPADGKIINIAKVSKKEVSINKGLIGRVNTLLSDVAEEGYLVSVFMSLFNVHINRAPIDGEIVSIKHKPGKFFKAYNIEKSFLNESNEIIMETRIGTIKIIQIAGFVARRIECFVKKKQEINKGDKIGRIIIGSQVSLILPKKIKLLVKVGDKVKAGETIFGKY